MTIIVHHLANSRSQRVLWLLEELGMPYEVRRYERDPRTMLAPAELRRVHPLGKAPLLEDEGMIVAETGAIAEYLVAKADGRLGTPADRDAALRYRFWLHYAEGSLMPVLFTKLVLSRIPLLGKTAMKKFQPMIDVHLDYVEGELAQCPWFAGADFTAADILMSFPLEAARHRAGLGPSRPATIAWLDRIHAREAYQRALERGGGLCVRLSRFGDSVSTPRMHNAERESAADAPPSSHRLDATGSRQFAGCPGLGG